MEEIVTSILSQVVFIVMIIMAARVIAAYLREDWGRFFSALIMGICCLIVVLFGPQIQTFAETMGSQLFN